MSDEQEYDDLESEFDDLAKIAQFSLPYQAHLLAGKLEAEGIEAFIQQEDSSSVLPYLAVTKSGISVLVKESQKEDALAVMKSIEDSVTPSADLPVALRIDGEIFDLVKGICPECSVPAVYLRRSGTVASTAAIAFVAIITLPIKLQHNYFCSNCQSEWEG